MSKDFSPTGQERRVRAIGGVRIAGAPIAYILTLSAVITALAFIPFSVVFGGGNAFPLSQGVYPLVGWILGPLGGAVAAGIGALSGTLMAPHTTKIWFVTILGGMASSFTAGAMVDQGPRRHWWIPLTVFYVLAFGAYGYRAVIVNGVSPNNFFAATFICWSAWILFVLPTRRLVSRWLKESGNGPQTQISFRELLNKLRKPQEILYGLRNPQIYRLPIALFLGTWMAAGLAHLLSSTLIYPLLNFPNEIWPLIAGAAPFEHFIRASVGTIIGTGVITGMRAIRLIRPTEALY